jgi:hypothetical protein
MLKLKVLNFLAKSIEFLQSVYSIFIIIIIISSVINQYFNSHSMFRLIIIFIMPRANITFINSLINLIDTILNIGIFEDFHVKI